MFEDAGRHVEYFTFSISIMCLMLVFCIPDYASCQDEITSCKPPSSDGTQVCFTLHKMKLNQPDAVAYCQNKKARLFLPKTKTEAEEIASFVNKSGENYIWVDGTETRLSWKDIIAWGGSWIPGLPDDSDTNYEGCAFLDGNFDYKWNHDQCYTYKQFICQLSQDKCNLDPQATELSDGRFCYRIFTEYLTWFNARMKCHANSGILVNILDKKASQTISSFLQANVNQANFWIGYARYVWMDQDGTPLDYFSWDALNPQPNNYWQTCILMQTTGGIWIDRACTLTFPFVCVSGQTVVTSSSNNDLSVSSLTTSVGQYSHSVENTDSSTSPQVTQSPGFTSIGTANEQHETTNSDLALSSRISAEHSQSFSKAGNNTQSLRTDTVSRPTSIEISIDQVYSNGSDNSSVSGSTTLSVTRPTSPITESSKLQTGSTFEGNTISRISNTKYQSDLAQKISTSVPLPPISATNSTSKGHEKTDIVDGSTMTTSAPITQSTTGSDIPVSSIQGLDKETTIAGLPTQTLMYDKSTNRTTTLRSTEKTYLSTQSYELGTGHASSVSTGSAAADGQVTTSNPSIAATNHPSSPTEKVPCRTGSRGITSCFDMTDGDYQSCTGCGYYITCFQGKLYPDRPCFLDTVWDDDLKRCEWLSTTCSTEIVTTDAGIIIQNTASANTAISQTHNGTEERNSSIGSTEPVSSIKSSETAVTQDKKTSTRVDETVTTASVLSTSGTISGSGFSTMDLSQTEETLQTKLILYTSTEKIETVTFYETRLSSEIKETIPKDISTVDIKESTETFSTDSEHTTTALHIASTQQKSTVPPTTSLQLAANDVSTLTTDSRTKLETISQSMLPSIISFQITTNPPSSEPTLELSQGQGYRGTMTKQQKFSTKITQPSLTPTQGLHTGCTTGVLGVESCTRLPDGDYQSCRSCRQYVTCVEGKIYENRTCLLFTVWDDNLKQCDWASSTCSENNIGESSSAPWPTVPTENISQQSESEVQTTESNTVRHTQTTIYRTVAPSQPTASHPSPDANPRTSTSAGLNQRTSEDNSHTKVANMPTSNFTNVAATTKPLPSVSHVAGTGKGSTTSFLAHLLSTTEGISYEDDLLSTMPATTATNETSNQFDETTESFVTKETESTQNEQDRWFFLSSILGMVAGVAMATSMLVGAYCGLMLTRNLMPKKQHPDDNNRLSTISIERDRVPVPDRRPFRLEWRDWNPAWTKQPPVYDNHIYSWKERGDRAIYKTINI